MQRRLAAIMLLDMVGYSRFMGLDEEGTIAHQKAHRDYVIDPTITQHGGRIVKSTGDGLLVEFPSVMDAVKCATEVQRELAGRDADVPEDRRIQYRIGINLGDIVIDGDDILGDGVNVAARLEGLAEPGGICISGNVHDQVKNKLDISFQDMGEQHLKNILEPMRAYRILMSDQDTGPVAPSAAVPLPLPDKPSIAVLPFDNMSGDPEQEFFADGMTEDIITELSRFEDLFVIARNTSFAYKGQRVKVKDVAQELGVRFILEGSVRKAGQRVRITAQLIDGQDGGHVWAERYDGALEDVFDLQEQVTSQVVGSIAPEIKRSELERIGVGGESAFGAAHELAWKAEDARRSAMHRRDTALLDRAIAMARDAVGMNAKCSVAYQTICMGYAMQSLFRWGDDPIAAAELAEEWAKKFVSQLPNSYMAYFSLGIARAQKKLFQDANRDFQYAHELNPNDSIVLRFWAWCEASAGEFESAKQHAHMAIRLSPRDPRIHPAYLALAMAAFIEKDAAAFEKWANKAIRLQPTAPIRRAMMIAYAADAGNQALLETHREALMRSSPDFIDSLFRGENQLFQKPEHMAMLLDGLRKAGFPK
jgi:adenylate cyclase